MIEKKKLVFLSLTEYIEIENKTNTTISTETQNSLPVLTILIYCVASLAVFVVVFFVARCCKRNMEVSGSLT